MSDVAKLSEQMSYESSILIFAVQTTEKTFYHNTPRASKM